MGGRQGEEEDDDEEGMEDRKEQVQLVDMLML